MIDKTPPLFGRDIVESRMLDGKDWILVVEAKIIKLTQIPENSFDFPLLSDVKPYFQSCLFCLLFSGMLIFIS